MRNRRFYRLSLTLLLGLAAALPSSARAESFREVRRRVYANPLSALPTYSVSLGTAIVEALANMSGLLIERGKMVLRNASDFKPKSPKIIHTYGICASGRWRIDQKSLATGLLAPLPTGEALDIPAIVRFSMAAATPVYKPGQKRQFAIAVKLFGTSDPDRAVLTRSLLVLSRFGLTGDDRASFFFPDDAREKTYFSNIGVGTGFFAWLGQHTFEKLDPHSDIRSLYLLAETGMEGASPAQAVAPAELYLVPRVARKISPMPADFRDEIRAYRSGEIRFDVVLPAQYGVPEKATVGSLVLDEPVLSETCDQELNFHHPRQDRDLRGKAP